MKVFSCRFCCVRLSRASSAVTSCFDFLLVVSHRTPSVFLWTDLLSVNPAGGWITLSAVWASWRSNWESSQNPNRFLNWDQVSVFHGEFQAFSQTLIVAAWSGDDMKCSSVVVPSASCSIRHRFIKYLNLQLHMKSCELWCLNKVKMSENLRVFKFVVVLCSDVVCL